MNKKLDYLIHYLEPTIDIPTSTMEKRQLLRALMNIRPPQAETAEFLVLQDQLLQQEVAEKGVVSLADLTPIQPQIYLWQGDITRLNVGAIVNAANSQLLGCFHRLYRQHHSLASRRATSPCLCGIDGETRAFRTHRASQNHSSV